MFNFVLPKGEQGTPGTPGKAATLKIGSVTSGSAPAVINAGTLTDAILNITLPEGQPGIQGPVGPAGTPGQVATFVIGVYLQGYQR